MDLLDQIVTAFSAWQRTLYAMLGAEIRSIGDGRAAVGSAITFALELGAVHALTPGHGKAVVFTYFIGSQSRAWSGIWMACKVAGAHVLSAAVLVALFGSAASIFGRPSGVARGLQAASYGVIVLMGLWFLIGAVAEARGETREHVHRHSGVLPFAVGLLPCPMTMLILTYSLANASLLAGAMLTLFLGIGIAATIAGVGSAGIIVRRGILGRLDPRARLYRRLIDVLQVVSSAAIVVLGAVFLTGTLVQ